MSYVPSITNMIGCLSVKPPDKVPLRNKVSLID